MVNDAQGEVVSVPGYSILTRIGSGGFAVVYAASRDVDGVDAAIKIATRSGDSRFAREAAALQRVGAPAAPALFDTGVTDHDRPYLVMELVRGSTLSTWLEGFRTHPLPLRIAIGAAIANAVAALHRQGVIHRDLKPANIILRADTEKSSKPDVALIDFGLAKLDESIGGFTALEDDIDGNLTAEGAQIGTVLYMSPEQCDGHPVDARADIYALGVILFELLVGRPPFDGDASSIAMAHTSRRPPLPSRVAGTPPALDAITLRCLAKRAEDRYSSAAEVSQAIESAIAAGHVEQRPSSTNISPAQSETSRPGRVPIALLSLRMTAPPEAVSPLLPAEAIIARMYDGGYVIAFPHSWSLEAGVRAAFAMGTRALALAEDAVVHVAPLIVRESPRGTSVIGAALDRVDDWAPQQGQRTVTATPDAAPMLGKMLGKMLGNLGTSSGPSTVETMLPPEKLTGNSRKPSSDALGDSDSRSQATIGYVAPPLRGREGLLAALQADAETCLAGTVGISTVLGEIGHGKTRILDELSAALAPRFARAVRVAAAAPEQNDPDSLSRALARVAIEVPDRASLQVVRAECEKRLGIGVADTMVAAIAYVLGAVDERDEVVARLLATPGALRRAIGRAIGLALQARAKEAPLAVLVDDAQWADPQSLDALEIATLAGTEASFFVVVAARPALTSQRPGWGERATRHILHDLPVLDDASMSVLVRDLLKPIEFVPDAAVGDLVRAAGGIPLYLVEAVHALRVGGKVRRRSTGEYYLAADELVSGSVTPLSERLSRRAVEQLAPALREILGLASVLGMDVDVADLSAVQVIVETTAPTFSSDESMDARVGLERLSRQGLLVATGSGRYRFRHAMLRDAIEQLVSPGRRRIYHEAAYRHIESQTGRHKELLPRLAHHAAAAGLTEAASNAYLELAELAARVHRYVEAEQHYSSALSLLAAERAAERQQVLAGRSKVRTVLTRHDDALADLQQAQTLAEELGDDHAVASLLLDEATLHDFLRAIGASVAAIERASPIVERLGEASLEARLDSARGRAYCRQNRRADAIEPLRRAATMAASLGDTRTQTEALLMLSTSLVAQGYMPEATEAFVDVIALCERTGDRFHLGVAHNNRIWLWVKQQDYACAIADQRVTIDIARELGNSRLEALASGNIAELLYYMGSMSEALVRARRMAELFRRLYGYVMPNAAIIAARVEAANGNTAEALAMIEEIRTRSPAEITGYTRALIRLVEIVINKPSPDEPAAWDAVLDELRLHRELDERVDAAYQAASRATQAGRWDEAQRRISDALAESPGPMWRVRFDALARELPR